MKNKFHNLLLAGLLTFAAGSLHAQTSMVPSAMNYQGMLTDANGDPVANAAPENRNVEFRIYSQATGGTPLWGEAQTVTVYRGHFSIVLGNGTAVGGAPSGPASFAAVFANAATADFYFGITPQGGAEFAPRQKLLSSAYALRARVAENVTQVGTTSNSLNNLTLNGDFTLASGSARINGSREMRFGSGLPGISPNSGVLNASSDRMNISGVSNTGNDSGRKLSIWAEAGTDFAGPISFGSRLGQHINLYGNAFGMGIQDNTMYSRTAGNFRWFLNGGHSNSDGSAGSGGAQLATLNGSGLTLHNGVFTGNGSGLTNINPNSLPNNYNYLGINGGNVIEFGRGVSKAASNGQIGYGTFSSGTALDIVGAGTQSNYSDRKINLHTQGGLTVYGGATVDGNLRTNGWTEAFGPIYAKNSVVIEGSGKLNFATPERTGQHINLYGNSYGIGIGGFSLYHRVPTDGLYRWYAGGTHDDGGPGAGGQEIANWSNARFDFNRRVNISANSSDGLAPLNVNGYQGGMWFQRFVAEFWNPNNGGAGYNGRDGWTFNTSIRASNAVAGSSFVAFSDSRLKLPEGRSDAARDLKTLAALEITDYTMKDKSVDGGQKHKKLIAQQLEKVFPQAVSKTQGTVPDIFRMATAKNGLITFKDAAKTDLKASETVRLLNNEGEVTTEVAKIKGNGFTVKDAVKDGDLFVYGRKVDDLRLVDYEAVSMLNVSATQELAKRVERLESENSILRDRLAKMEATLTAVAAKVGVSGDAVPAKADTATVKKVSAR